MLEHAEETPRKGNILLVDDEQNILSSLRRLLNREGYNIHMALSGIEGLEILKENDIDIVVSDMRMPQMDGAEFLKNVAEGWPDIYKILLTGFADIQSTIDAINNGGINNYISKPWDDRHLKVIVRSAMDSKLLSEEKIRLEALTKEQNKQLKDLNENLERKVQERTEDLQKANQLLEQSNSVIKENYHSSIKVFANITQMNCETMHGHSRRIAEHAKLLAEKSDLGEQECQDIYYAGLLHNLGKIGLPEEIIRQPYAFLVPKELAVFHKYPGLGAAALLGLEHLENVSNIIHHHKERYCGKGYPDGLEADNIPLGSQILSIAVDYEELQNAMLTKEKLSSADALDYIGANKNSRYNPELAKAFIELIKSDCCKKQVNKELSYNPIDLKENMVLSRDLINQDGIMLLTSGTVLKENLINRLHSLQESSDERLLVYVEANAD